MLSYVIKNNLIKQIIILAFHFFFKWNYKPKEYILKWKLKLPQTEGNQRQCCECYCLVCKSKSSTFQEHQVTNLWLTDHCHWIKVNRSLELHDVRVTCLFKSWNTCFASEAFDDSPLNEQAPIHHPIIYSCRVMTSSLRWSQGID